MQRKESWEEKRGEQIPYGGLGEGKKKQFGEGPPEEGKKKISLEDWGKKKKLWTRR